MRTVAVLWSLATVFVAPHAASAWGGDGHRIVGDIAWHELEAEVVPKVRQFLPNGRYGSLHEAAIWADQYARLYKRYDWLKTFHYVESDPSADQVTVGDDCECVVGAITRFSEQLVDDSVRYGLRVNALRLVAHFVGDIHQPLHVGHPDGRGGNETTVEFDGERMKLHLLWDTALIRYHLSHLSPSIRDDPWEPDVEVARSVEPSWEAYAEILLGEITDEQRQAWTASLDPELWANESFDLMKEHAFHIVDGQIIETGFCETIQPVIALRLKQAGVRLGALLNQLLRE